MDKIVRYCDHCGEQISLEHTRFVLPVATHIDVPSGKTETTDENLDLCPKAQAEIVCQFFSQGKREREPGIDSLVSWGKHCYDRWKRRKV